MLFLQSLFRRINSLFLSRDSDKCITFASLTPLSLKEETQFECFEGREQTRGVLGAESDPQKVYLWVGLEPGPQYLNCGYGD